MDNGHLESNFLETWPFLAGMQLPKKHMDQFMASSVELGACSLAGKVTLAAGQAGTPIPGKGEGGHRSTDL